MCMCASEQAFSVLKVLSDSQVPEEGHPVIPTLYTPKDHVDRVA